MAARTTVTTICDMPHDQDTAAEGTVSLAYGKDRWNIDLCAPCRTGLEIALAPFADRARPARKAPHSARTRPARRQGRARREWCQANGWPVADRGKLPAAAAAAADKALGFSR